jgi:hypothetical protein
MWVRISLLVYCSEVEVNPVENTVDIVEIGPIGPVKMIPSGATDATVLRSDAIASLIRVLNSSSVQLDSVQIRALDLTHEQSLYASQIEILKQLLRLKLKAKPGLEEKP